MNEQTNQQRAVNDACADQNAEVRYQWEHIDALPDGQWFAVWDMGRECWVTGKSRGEQGVWWVSAPRCYRPAQCLILPTRQYQPGVQGE